MKKFLSSSNIFVVILLIYVGINQYRSYSNNSKYEGKKLKIGQAFNYQEQTMLTFPPKGQKVITVFWSSTCAPCMLEMARLESSVKSGSIPTSKIFAINMWENDKIIKKFIKKKAHPFTFIKATHTSDQLQVMATPSTIFINDGVIEKFKSGLSFVGIWQAENFVK